ncbi:MAG: hypothetical protein HY394_06040 [Candidatus Diapherotrites archaeon]|nr:hypothetical protein [Candidatus Diapherotrites archaeon]
MHYSPGSPADRWYNRLGAWITRSIQRFVGFLFLLLAAGIIIGVFVATNRPQYIIPVVLAPILIALLSYYSRGIAILIFILFILGFFGFFAVL